MKFKDINSVYFIGIGGIGMSAIARFFNAQGKTVKGYDKTETELTKALEKEGIEVFFTDRGEAALKGLDQTSTLVVFTPAIPKQHLEFQAFHNNNYTLIKRAKALGIISQSQDTFAVAGTHGKTTTSSIMAHVLYSTNESCNAFIGGITTNYNSNYLIAEESNRVVVEADEFDRSFMELSPDYTIITSTDADHLDIYGAANELEKSFIEFAERTSAKGILMVQSDLNFENYQGTAKKITYGFDVEKADWKGFNLTYKKGDTFFDIEGKEKGFKAVKFGLPGKHNAENALAVFALLYEIGISEEQIRNTFESYLGVKRRFEYHLKKDNIVVIEDYAHHPSEITAFLKSVKQIYPDKIITAIFQPHLFSRTKDFMDDFAQSLTYTNRLYLLEIYPARELPIEGITSQVLFNKIELTHKEMSSKKSIIADLKKVKHDIIVVLGAGDIANIVQPIVNEYE